MLNYLHYIKRTWTYILGDVDESLLEMTDDTTIRQLECLMPSQSKQDSQIVRNLMDTKAIFPRVTEAATRAKVLDNLLAVDVLIPSLRTFFENLKYLEPCAKIMRSLLTHKKIVSIKQALSGSYFHPADHCIEYGPGDTRLHVRQQYDADLASAYHTLWLFALRNFPQMTSTTPKKSPNGSRPVITEPNPAIWQEFGILAQDLGFRTEAVQTMAAQNSQSLLATLIVDKAGIESSQQSEMARRIAQLLCSAKLLQPGVLPSSPGCLEWVPPERRCGRPYQDDHLIDRTKLYLPFIYTSPASMVSEITTAFCKRDMFRAFFSILQVL